MNLRTKATLFFGAFLFTITLGIIFYAEYVVGNVFKKQAVSNLRIIAEQSESAYLSFLGSMKVRVIDWTSDAALRDRAKAVMNAPYGSTEREIAAKEFGRYVTKKKMPFDETIVITDLLDKNGVVIASSRNERIGKNEAEEETKYRKVHDINKTLDSKFGEAFFGTIVLKGSDYTEPVTSVTVKLFEPREGGVREPLDLVLLVYYSNVTQIADVLGSGTSIYAGMSTITGRQTQSALLEEYKTSNIYLVNNDSYMATPSRSIKDVQVMQKVDTLPARECLENGKEVNEEYDNYQGVRVLGASMCFQKEGLVLIAEIQKDEIFAPLTALVRSTAIGGVIALVFGILIIAIFISRLITRLNDVVNVAKQVTKGDLDTFIKVRTTDELGYLASVFNVMINAIRDNKKYMQEARDRAEEGIARDDALLASLGEGMIATDRSGNIITINRAAEKMLALESADVIGRNAIDVIGALDENGNEIPREQRALFMSATMASTISRTMLYQRKGGGYIPVATTITPVVLGGRITGSIEIFREISAEKEIEKTRTDLLSLASHQLRTPLSGTKWLIETLKKGVHGPLNKNQEEYLNEIYKINERMTGLVHDMLDVLRMEGGGAQAKKEKVSIKALLATVFETLHSVAESKKISIRLPESDDCSVNTDPLLLRNILESMVTNAINYSEDGQEVVISLGQRLRSNRSSQVASSQSKFGDSSQESSNELIIAVKDSGIGIPRNEQRQIFERFYRATNAKTFDTRGSGLGLYIATMLAKKIGARLSFESEVGKGSTFYVHLPIESDALPESVARV